MTKYTSKEENLVRELLTFLGSYEVMEDEQYLYKDAVKFSKNHAEVPYMGEKLWIGNNTVILQNGGLFNELPELYYNLRKINKKLAYYYLLYYVKKWKATKTKPTSQYLIKNVAYENGKYKFLKVVDGLEVIEEIEDV